MNDYSAFDIYQVKNRILGKKYAKLFPVPKEHASIQ